MAFSTQGVRQIWSRQTRPSRQSTSAEQTTGSVHRPVACSQTWAPGQGSATHVATQAPASQRRPSPQAASSRHGPPSTQACVPRSQWVPSGSRRRRGTCHGTRPRHRPADRGSPRARHRPRARHTHHSRRRSARPGRCSRGRRRARGHRRPTRPPPFAPPVDPPTEPPADPPDDPPPPFAPPVDPPTEPPVAPRRRSPPRRCLGVDVEDVRAAAATAVAPPAAAARCREQAGERDARPTVAHHRISSASR
jgi:hypothetical protein